MTWMILHAKFPLNHPRDPGQRPQVRRETRNSRTLQQDRFQLLLLPQRQPSRTSWMRFGSECLQASLLQVLLPPGNRRRGSADQPGYFPNSLTLLEQPATNEATYFQCFCTAFWSHSECIIPVCLFL